MPVRVTTLNNHQILIQLILNRQGDPNHPEGYKIREIKQNGAITVVTKRDPEDEDVAHWEEIPRPAYKFETQ